MGNNLAIIICATANYQAALLPQARAIAQNVAVAGIQSGHIILATDETVPTAVLERYKAVLGGWEVHHLPLALTDEKKSYSPNAQLLIAQLYSAAFDKARALDVDLVWSVEADVIPEPNNLRCMRDMLSFDGGYYDISFCPYVSQGGGGIMGGRGTPQNWILPNWGNDEADLSPALAEQMKTHLVAKPERPAKEWEEHWKGLQDEAKKCEPKGNVFTLNGQKWKKRGWFEWAYPAIGKGAVVPSDWMPMGNNLFSRKALNHADFTGYSGRGTQDLYLGYLRFAANGLRICVIPHSPCGHVIRKKNADGGDHTIIYLSHETEGECIGHLRQREAPFYTHEPGERIPDKAEDYAI